MVMAAASLAGWACVRSVAALVPVLTLGAFASPLFMTSCTSLLSKVPQESEVGRVLGVGVSVDCGARIVVPLTAGVLLGRRGALAGAGAPGRAPEGRAPGRRAHRPSCRCTPRASLTCWHLVQSCHFYQSLRPTGGPSLPPSACSWPGLL